MAQSKREAKREIAHYAHADKERLNNPPVGLVTPDTDRDVGKKTYAYDPRLDPQLSGPGRPNIPRSRCPRSPCTFTSGSIPTPLSRL
jgi:hypothetical protein